MNHEGAAANSPHPRKSGLIALPRRIAILLSSFLLFLYLSANGRLTIGLSVSHPSTPAPQKAERTRVAAGEYQMFQTKNEGAVGPFGAAVYNFRESWTLCRLATGGYQVEGLREFDSPLGEFHKNRFQARLSGDLRVLSVAEFAKLRWRPDSGPLTCEFKDRELHCSSNAKDPQQAIELNIPMTHPFGFLWPISPFSLSGIARASGKHVHQVTPVQLVQIEEPDADNPVSPLVLDAELRYLGQENIRVARQTWHADKFQLDVPLHSSYQMWISPEGILLSLFAGLGTNNEPSRKMDLVRYEKSAGF